MSGEREAAGTADKAAAIVWEKENGALDLSGGKGGDKKWWDPGNNLEAEPKRLHPD